MMLLEAADLRVDYPADEDGPHPALGGVSLTATAGERTAIVGPNGSGKSTLLFVLAGLRRPDGGSVRLRALPATAAAAEDLRDPSRLRAHEIAARVGVVFQDPELGFVARNAREEVLATDRAARERGKRGSSRPGDSDGVLARFGLGHLASESPFQLSQGEQRRLSLAALVLRPPAVLLLDEPTFGLDRRGTEAVVTLLDELRAGGQAQFLATHDPRLLPACDRVVALDHGRIVFDGPPSGFLAAPPYSPARPWTAGAQADEPAGTAGTAR